MNTSTPENVTQEKPKIIAKEHIKLWAYLNITHPLVAWEIAIGRICSADDPSLEKFSSSLWFYSLMHHLSKNGLNRRFLNELLLEQARIRTCPDAISRLRGVYFFESEEDAISAVSRWGVPQNRRFISSVNFAANALTRVDSEWITWKLQSEDRDWMPRYWAGETYGEKPLTEILASGIGLVENMELRQEAMRWIYQNWPYSTPVFSMSACAFRESLTQQPPELESLGLTVPVLTRDKDCIRGNFMMNLRALDTHPKEVAQAVQACRQRGEDPPWIMSEDPNVFFQVPDLSRYAFEVKDIKAAETLEAIHTMSVSPDL